MTIKEKIRIHHQIEQENKRKLKNWKEEKMRGESNVKTTD